MEDGPRFPVDFRDADLEADLHGASQGARSALRGARAELDRAGIPKHVLRRPDQHDLPGCLKAYVDAKGVTRDAGAPWGLVLQLVPTPRAGVRLEVLAFGERHPVKGWSVYDRAARRLKG